MIHRRLAKLVAVLLAIWCLWLTFRSDFEVVIPIVQNYSAGPASRIAKVTVAVNTLNSSIIHQALHTHKVQNDLHGYIHHIATDEVVGDMSESDPKRRPRGAWSKPAYLLSVIIAELTKPESERLKWVLYV